MKGYHLIILGHGQGDNGAVYPHANTTERELLLTLGRELKLIIKSFNLPVHVEDTYNIYKQKGFVNNTEVFKAYDSVTEIHLNSDGTGKATGGEILFAEGLKADDMDKRFESYLKQEFGFRRYILSDWYQQTRHAKQVGLKSFRLVELFFGNNPIDLNKFLGRERYHAKRILEVILDKDIIIESNEIPPFTTKFIIQLGAFNEYENAQQYLKSVVKHFPDAFIRRVK